VTSSPNDHVIGALVARALLLEKTNTVGKSALPTFDLLRLGVLF
jgi:hypothetical protein